MKGQLGYRVRTIRCDGCGQEKTGHMRPKQRYCSVACRTTAPKPERATGRSVPCAVCEAPVYIPKNRLGHERYFCTKEHADEWAARTKVSVRCGICSVEFLASPSRADRKYCSLACRDADPKRREQLLAMNLKQQRGGQTRIETIGYELLAETGEVHFRQHVIGGRFTVDVFVPRVGLVVQFDGDYWHCNPDKFDEPDARQKKRMHLDASQDAYMRACGYRVLRFWESDILHRVDHVRASLRAALVPQGRADAAPA